MEGGRLLIYKALIVTVSVQGRCSSNLSHYIDVGTQHVPHLPYLGRGAQLEEVLHVVLEGYFLTAAAAGPYCPLTLTLNFLPRFGRGRFESPHVLLELSQQHLYYNPIYPGGYVPIRIRILVLLCIPGRCQSRLPSQV